VLADPRGFALAARIAATIDAGGVMHRVMKKLVATMLAAVAIAAPATALADDGGECASYDQVKSSSTGGDYVGGRLIYESEGSVTRSEPTTTTTTTTTGSAGVPGTGTSITSTTTTTQPGTSTTTQEPIGYYAMNDGTIWTINCVTGDEKKVSN
jgi:hypothetical protein